MWVKIEWKTRIMSRSDSVPTPSKYFKRHYVFLADPAVFLMPQQWHVLKKKSFSFNLDLRIRPVEQSSQSAAIDRQHKKAIFVAVSH